jgi:hypothetical protein
VGRPSLLQEGFLVPGPTQIEPEKIRAYLATSYRLRDGETDIVLEIGRRSDEVAALLQSRGVSCGAFITAYNPRGTIQSQSANDRAHADLATAITKRGLQAIEGSGSEDGSAWPPEPSYFVPGLDLEAGRNLGTQFAQDAIVWVGGDAVPQLILLR